MIIVSNINWSKFHLFNLANAALTFFRTQYHLVISRTVLFQISRDDYIDKLLFSRTVVYNLGKIFLMIHAHTNLSTTRSFGYYHCETSSNWSISSRLLRVTITALSSLYHRHLVLFWGVCFAKIWAKPQFFHRTGPRTYLLLNMEYGIIMPHVPASYFTTGTARFV